jgi:CBS domain-containing protein
LFNLIPAFPIDGGRILRSVLAKRMDYIKATKTASNIGKGFAIAMAVFGIFYNIWLVLIAVFVYIGASSEEKTSEISMALENVKVKDIMTTNIDAVSPELTIHEFSEHMQTHKHLGYPVIEDKHLLGLITINELHKVVRGEQDNLQVKDVMHKDVLSISPDDDAYTAFRLMTKNHHERLIVKKVDNVLGIVSWSDILHAIRLKGV